MLNKVRYSLKHTCNEMCMYMMQSSVVFCGDSQTDVEINSRLEPGGLHRDLYKKLLRIGQSNKSDKFKFKTQGLNWYFVIC